MRPFLLLLLSSLISFSANSQSRCSQIFLSKSIFEASYDFEISFNNVEVFRRNNDIGLQQVGDLQFKRWFEINSQQTQMQTQSFLGLTRDGQLFHLLQFGNRKIARRLSGKKEFIDFYVSASGGLVAISKDFHIEVYDARKWKNNKGSSSIISRGLGLWAGLTGVTIASAHLFGADIPSPLLERFIAVTMGLQTFFVMLNRYGYYNTFPDGFTTTRLKFESLSQLNVDLSQKLLMKLTSRENHFEPQSLSELPAALPEAATQVIE